jgi:hypothetical protein
MLQTNTVTFFAIDDRVRLGTEAGYGDVDARLVGIGRRFLAVRLDNGRVVRRIWPAWITRPTPRRAA